MTKKIILIGNGENRLGTDFNTVPGYKIGCNAVYRDIKVDSLVCVDRRMVAEALENNFHNTIYTRSDWVDQFRFCDNVEVLPDLPYKGNNRLDDPWHWGSGPHACNLAGTMLPEEIHLYGFDLWGNDLKINNVYKDTRNYDPSNHHSIDPRYWIYQISKCFDYYPRIKWIQHQPRSWKKPAEWISSNLIVTE